MTDSQDQSRESRPDQQCNHIIENFELCPQYHQAIELIGQRWMGVILLALMKGPHRFTEIENMVPGISHRLLTERLRELEEQHIVIRRVIPSSPVKVEYELTEVGLDLQDTVTAIRDWGKKWLSSG